MKITKAVREALRRELTAKEYTPQDITVVMTARYGARPRLALRWAHGMPRRMSPTSGTSRTRPAARR